MLVLLANVKQALHHLRGMSQEGSQDASKQKHHSKGEHTLELCALMECSIRGHGVHKTFPIAIKFDL